MLTRIAVGIGVACCPMSSASAQTGASGPLSRLHQVWRYECRFPNQPPIRIAVADTPCVDTIRFGSEKPVALNGGGSVGTGMMGRGYDVVRRGKLFAFAIGAEGKPDAARLNIWPTSEGYSRGVTPKYVNGTCRLARIGRERLAVDPEQDRASKEYVTLSARPLDGQSLSAEEHKKLAEMSQQPPCGTRR